mmetsp:Transcript_32507/g.48457  ORF Transcript_32507/g.48457 Transcript_32507/m.48457 type:complete len:91 (-) Transcript_32507:647-919(-)
MNNRSTVSQMNHALKTRPLQASSSTLQSEDVSSLSLSSGWGSTSSRKSYMCLASLAPSESNDVIVGDVEPVDRSGEGWGYYVDVGDATQT